jgi:hypothetical protein
MSKLGAFFRRYEGWVVLGIMLLALALRLYGLTRESLWYDEAYAVWSSSMAAIGSLRVLWEWKIEFALYYLVMHYWIRLFGNGEGAVRALVALVGTLTVLPVYLLGRELDRDATPEPGSLTPCVAVVGALLLALNPAHVWYSQEVRSYAMAVLFTATSLLALRRIQRGGGWGWWVGYILVSGLAFHLHYFIGWVVLAENVHQLWFLWRAASQEGAAGRWRRLWRNLRWWLLAEAGVGLIALTALAIFLNSFLLFNQWGYRAASYVRPGLEELLRLATFLTLGTAPWGPGVLRRALTAMFFLPLAWALWRGRGTIYRAPTLVLLLLAAGLPVALVFALGQVATLWVPRYLLVALPPTVLLIAWGIGEIRGRGEETGGCMQYAPTMDASASSPLPWRAIAARGRRFVPVFILHPSSLILSLTLLLATVLALWQGYVVPQKEDWRGVARYVQGRIGAQDVIVLMDEECRVPFDYYYGAGSRRVEVSRFADAAALDKAAVTIQEAQRGGQLWVVVSHANGAALEARLRAVPGLLKQPAPAFTGIALWVYQWP